MSDNAGRKEFLFPASEFNHTGLVINFTGACLFLKDQVSQRASDPEVVPSLSDPQVPSTAYASSVQT